MLKFDKSIYAGLCTPDFSKWHLYKHHYEYMKPKSGDKCQLVANDTDIFFYGVETDDINKDVYGHA